MKGTHQCPLYLYALRTRKSAGLTMRKLSVTKSHRIAQFFGTSSVGNIERSAEVI